MKTKQKFFSESYFLLMSIPYEVIYTWNEAQVLKCGRHNCIRIPKKSHFLTLLKSHSDVSIHRFVF